MAMDPATPQAEYAILHDARCVHDVARLRRADYDGGDAWVLAVIVPAPGSGTATVPGAHIDADTGAVVVPPDAGLVITYEGEWSAAASAGAALPQRGRYAWTVPADEEKRGVDPEDVYSPFARGGTAVMRPAAMAGTPEALAPVRLVFPEWREATAAALAEGTDPTAGVAGGDAGPVLARLDDKNPLIAVLALRAAIEAAAILPPTARAVVDRAAGPRKSAMVYLMLAIPPPDRGPGQAPDGRAAWVEAVVQAAAAATSREELRAFALGGFAAGVLPGPDRGVAEGGRAVLRAVRRRLDALGLPAEPGTPLAEMLRQMAIE